MGDRNWPWFRCRDQNWLGLCVAVKKNLFLVSGSKLSRFLCRGIEIDLIGGWHRNWLSFSDAVEISLVFWRGIEIDLVLMWVSKLIFLERGVEIDFVVVFGRPLFGFHVWIEIYLVLVRRWRLTWVFCAGRKSIVFMLWLTVLCVGGRNCFCTRAENDLFWCGDRLTCFWCGWSKFTYILYADRKSFGFSGTWFLYGWSKLIKLRLLLCL